ncbi:hypothetical protein [Chitinophaga filiformis]|uniref:Uncharacterized protein n=1 Tax=Chitinophaga filiformis TaxID=104663 RepID=A0A1G8BEE2_CHIFI|nr:hypothetical protein [Chitinophaga filiformis]SDH31393.1 hypothetical protein SAMN04488121_11114 [Chitinophaga filiformis]
MGKQKGLFPFTGPLGNKIGYRRGNNYFYRERPQHVNRTIATKKAATDFGTASHCACLIRKSLSHYLRRHRSDDLINRLNTAFIDIVNADTCNRSGQRVPDTIHIHSLKGFQFNEATGINQLLTAAPLIEKDDTGKISVALPAKAINSRKIPAGVTHFTITAIALSLNFSRHKGQLSTSHTAVIKRGEHHEPLTLTIDKSSQELTLILLEVRSASMVNGQLYYSNSKTASALDIISVIPPVKPPRHIRRNFRNKTPRCWAIPTYTTPITQPAHKLPVSFIPLPGD